MVSLWCFGEALVDQFEDGSSVVGGAPFNVAWHLHGFGFQPRLITRLGRDEQGEWIRKAMFAWGMTMERVEEDPVLPTGRVDVRLRDSEPDFRIAVPAAYDAIETAGGAAPDVLYHGTLALRDERSRSSCLALAAHSRVRRFVDVNLRAPFWNRASVLAWLEGACWVKLNEAELTALTLDAAPAHGWRSRPRFGPGAHGGAVDFCNSLNRLGKSVGMGVACLRQAGKQAIDQAGRTSTMNEEQARKRIEDLKGFYGHLVAYVATNAFLIVINLITTDFLWFVFPLLGWGIGLAIHAAEVFWTGADWESRKLEELTGLKETKDEVQRLAERTDVLVTILASVDWARIDPELMHTQKSLEAAQDRITRLRGNSDPAGQAEVTREIERLEEFVTSSKFDYYEQASRSN